ncbi:MAG: signal peptidase I [Micavibrio sp.]|nr:MAG: signal peptidase I [Micavibrio sp.]
MAKKKTDKAKKEVSIETDAEENGSENKDAVENTHEDDSEITTILDPEKEDRGFWSALALAAVLAFCFRIFLYQPFNIPSSSMYPNLLIGDYLFVSKLSYGYSRFSFPDFLHVDFRGRVFEKQPERGDIAVFRQPYERGIDYIKRIIGLPGDTVQMRSGELYINGERVPRTFIDIREHDDEGVIETFSKYETTLPNGVTHYIYEKSDDEYYDNTPLFTVPDGHYFFMGDSRDASLDSRSDRVGMIPADHLIGRATIIFFSTAGIGDSCPVREGFFAHPRMLGCIVYNGVKNIRYRRIFRHIR